MTPLRFRSTFMLITSFARTARSAISVQRRQGAIVPLVAVLLVVILALAAFAVDVGFIALADTELQRTADTCALAAVLRLPNESDAIEAAQRAAQNNQASSGPELGVSDVQFGFWDRDTATFGSEGSEGSDTNAVRVTLERTQANGNALTLFFTQVIGTSYADVTATATAMYDTGMCGPLIGIDSVSVPGEPTTDSFRTSRGSYADQAPRDNGSICSDGPIGLEGNPIINGDANSGKSYRTTLEGAAVVTGNTSPRLRPLKLPGVNVGAYEFDNDNETLPGILKGKQFVDPVDGNGNFLVDGGKTYDMPSGTYYFNDLTLTGNSTLNITGPTVIYLTGNLDTAGGYLVNTTQDASNLQIFMDGGTAIVTSAVDLYAFVYAPQTIVELRGSANFYGAVVGKTLMVTGSGDIHYDEDLNIIDALRLPKRVSLVQ